MGLWPSACFVFLAILQPTHQTREWVTVESKGQGSFALTNEYGIVPSKLNSVVFHIRACSDAVVVISDIASITNTKGHYFLAMIGKKNNAETQVMDSCFTCDRTVIVKGPLLECKVFKPFWAMWDGQGLFKFGQGTVVGRNVTLTLQGTQGRYMGNFIQVTSTNGVTANFKFPLENPPRFVSPMPDGSTVLYVNETEAVGADLLAVTVEPISLDVVLNINGDGAEDFGLVNRTLRIAKPLDYETRQYYTLTVGSDEGFAVALTISVLDENDETPSLTVFHVAVPEEIPVGTLIGGFYNVIDRDKGDNLTYSLSGEGADLFTALGKGHLKVIKRIDRDGSDGIRELRNLTLTITDLVGHNTSGLLNITVLDVNDNPPVCNPTVLTFNTPEASAEDVELKDLTSVCNDQDLADNSNLTFLILGESWLTSVFSVNNGTLIARAGGLDRENSTQRSTIVFFVQVQDNAQSGAKRKTYIQVTVKVLPVNEFAPVWRSLKDGQTDELQPVTITSATPVGLTIASLAATDKDKGDNPLVYSILSITTDSGSDGVDFLQLDSSSGHLMVKSPLIGVKSLLAHAQASDGTHTIQAKLTVTVIDRKTDKVPSTHTTNTSPLLVRTTSVPPPQETNSKSSSNSDVPYTTDPSPHSNITHQKLPSLSYFDKRLYHMRIPSTGDIGKSVLNFTVKPLSSTEVLVVEMPAGKYFSVQKTPHWHLLYKSFSKRTIPTVIPLFVKDRTTKKIIDEAYVIIKPEKCDKVTPGPVHSKPVVKSVKETVPVTNMQTYSQECAATMSMKALTLVIVAAIQGVVLGGILAVFAYKKFTRGKKQSAVVPERKEPLGSVDVFKHSEFPEKSSKLPEILRRDERRDSKLEEEKPPTEACDTVIELGKVSREEDLNQKYNNGEESEEKRLGDNSDTVSVGDKRNERTDVDALSTIDIEDKGRELDSQDGCQKDRSTVVDGGQAEPGAEHDMVSLKQVEEGMRDIEQADELEDELADVVNQSEVQQVGTEGDGNDGEVCSDTDRDRSAGIDDSIEPVDIKDAVREEANLDTEKGFMDFLNSESDQAELGGQQPEDLLSGSPNTKVLFDDQESELPKSDKSLAVPDNSEASGGEEAVNADDDYDDEEEEEEEEEVSEDDDAVGDSAEAAGIAVSVAGAAAVAGVVGVTVKKRKKIRKVKKEKPKKEKKPKLRKIDFTQSPYNFSTK